MTITKQVQQFQTKNDKFFELSEEPVKMYEQIKKIKSGLTSLEKELQTLNEL